MVAGEFARSVARAEWATRPRASCVFRISSGGCGRSRGGPRWSRRANREQVECGNARRFPAPGRKRRKARGSPVSPLPGRSGLWVGPQRGYRVHTGSDTERSNHGSSNRRARAHQGSARSGAGGRAERSRTGEVQLRLRACPWRSIPHLRQRRGRISARPRWQRPSSQGVGFASPRPPTMQTRNSSSHSSGAGYRFAFNRWTSEGSGERAESNAGARFPAVGPLISCGYRCGGKRRA